VSVEKLKNTKWWIVTALAMGAGWGAAHLLANALAGDCVGWGLTLVIGAVPALIGSMAHVLSAGIE
jgi:hypothetical protein